MTRAVIAGRYKLMAYKDEYEVARLATRTDAEQRMRDLFDGDVEIVRKLHPPTLRGVMRGKVGFGRGLRPMLSLLSRAKGLRGTAFDPFGRTESRKLERELIAWYRDLITEAVGDLNDSTYEIAVELARLPEEIRGYEHVKTTAVVAARRRAEVLLAQMRRS